MATFSLTTASAIFKTFYLKLSENVYNSATVLLGRLKKSYEFTGNQLFIAVPLSFQGGVGSGTLPTAGVATYVDAVITAKSVYSVVTIQREAIKASADDKGAFLRGLKEVVKKGVESWMRNMNRILFNDGTGNLGTTTAVSGSNPYTLTFGTGITTFNEANFEENDIVNIGTGNTDPFQVTSVLPATFQITVNRLSGSQVPTSAMVVNMQNSENNDPQGLKGTVDPTSGTVYGVTVQRRWQATQIAAGGVGITADLLNQLMSEVERKCGKVPDLLLTSFLQYRKVQNLIEDQKQYIIPPRYGSDELKAQISFTGLMYMSSRGPIGIFPDRFCQPDRIYAINTEQCEIFHRPDFGWFDDDGTVFLRDATSDQYSARYGGYLQVYLPPPFLGKIDGLSTTG